MSYRCLGQDAWLCVGHTSRDCCCHAARQGSRSFGLQDSARTKTYAIFLAFPRVDIAIPLCAYAVPRSSPSAASDILLSTELHSCVRADTALMQFALAQRRRQRDTLAQLQFRNGSAATEVVLSTLSMALQPTQQQQLSSLQSRPASAGAESRKHARDDVSAAAGSAINGEQSLAGQICYHGAKRSTGEGSEDVHQAAKRVKTSEVVFGDGICNHPSFSPSAPKTLIGMSRILSASPAACSCDSSLTGRKRSASPARDHDLKRVCVNNQQMQ